MKLNSELKRCSDIVGIFPNEATATGQIGAFLLEQIDEWAPARPLHDTSIHHTYQR